MKEVENTPSLNHCENNSKDYDGTFLPTISDGTCGMSCTVGKKSNFIINGNDTNRGEFPFVALISYLYREKKLLAYMYRSAFEQLLHFNKCWLCFPF